MLNMFLGIFREGGWILWPIFGVSIIAWYIGFGKMYLLKKIKRARAQFSKAFYSPGREAMKRVSTGFAPYDMLFYELQRTPQLIARRNEYVFREFLANVVPDLEYGFSTISACVSIAPLLGLLGTISGMNRMFSVITDVGLGSPGLMAGGISIALESALSGLAVAVAAMFFYNYLFNKKNRLMRTIMNDGQRLLRGTVEAYV